MRKLNWAFVLAALLLFSGVAFAAQTAVAPAAAAAADGGHWWKGILQGVLGGLLASVAGYFKNRDTKTGDHQQFELQYMVQTCIFGALLGLIAGLFKKNPTDFLNSAQASPLFAGGTMIFEAIMKAIWRNGVVKVRELIDDFKGGAANPTPLAPPTP
jgi:hypothetical protein